MYRWLRREEEEWWGRRQVMRLAGPADHPHRSQPPIQPPPPAAAGRTGVWEVQQTTSGQHHATSVSDFHRGKAASFACLCKP